MLPPERRGIFYPNIPAICLELSIVLNIYTQRSANVGLFYLLFCSRNCKNEQLLHVEEPHDGVVNRTDSSIGRWLHRSTVAAVYASRGLELFVWRLVPQWPILSVYKKPYNIYSIFYTNKSRWETRLRQSVDLTIDRKPHRPSQKEHIHECLANSLTCVSLLGNG